MNRLYKLAHLCGATLLLGSSCSNFLDIVPDERPTEKDAYSDRNKGIDYLYSCYAYLPNPAGTTGSLDLLTGDEVITSFEHESFSSFPKGKYTPLLLGFLTGITSSRGFANAICLAR